MGKLYIGMSNTRGVVMQIHLHRFQTPLLANLAGLAAAGTWLSATEHSVAGLASAALWCFLIAWLGRLWRRLLKDTALNLDWWNLRIYHLETKLGIKDYDIADIIEFRPKPQVNEGDLYLVLKLWTVVWIVLGFIALLTALSQIGGVQWIFWKLHLWLVWHA